MTPEGQKICFAFNNVAEKCNKERCGFVHACGVCYKKNVPMYDCRHPALQ